MNPLELSSDSDSDSDMNIPIPATFRSINLDEITLSARSICVAAKEGDLETLIYLVENGRSINSSNPHGWTPLHFAVCHNREDCLDYLLASEDIRINAETHSGQTALYIACSNYYEVPSSVVQKLINAGADMNIVQNDYKSPLHAVCEGPKNIENMKKAEILINNGAELDTKEYYEGDTPLFAAIEERNLNLVNMLLYAGADANYPRHFDQCTPLIIAAQTDNYEVFEALLPFVSDINQKTVDGRTALMLAQNDNIIKSLIEHGADPNVIAIDKPVTAVHLAAFRRNLNKLLLLLPKTSYSVICACNEYNLISVIADTVESHSDLETVFDCVEYLMSCEIDNSVFFLPYACTYYFPPIGSLFIPCVLTANESIWERYLSIFYLFLSKGINVNPEFNQQCLLIAFINIYKDWSPRLGVILKILIDHGLNADHFARLFMLKRNYVFDRLEFNVNFIIHLIPYFFSHAYSIYKYYDDLNCQLMGPPEKFHETFEVNNLKNYCRSAIRKIFKSNCLTTADYLAAVNSLEIPVSLKDYIRFKCD